MIKIYNTDEVKIGYDFYLDIAMRINKKRDMSLRELSEMTAIKSHRINNIMYAKTRVKLFELIKIAEALSTTVDYLIGADIDSDTGECLYTVTFTKYYSKGEVNTDPMRTMTIYQKATSKELAALKLEQHILDKYNNDVYKGDPLLRAFVRLVGIPVTDKDIQEHFTKYDETKDVLMPE
ncbi:helix-turn-helix domain-containing protein [Lactococcus formosensis]|uniref:helix-turn-helix domain-containing protein n=1 Tax=Lactococcus formosensis TaxID=1281486 RepID=UPI003853C942